MNGVTSLPFDLSDVFELLLVSRSRGLQEAINGVDDQWMAPIRRPAQEIFHGTLRRSTSPVLERFARHQNKYYGPV
jgi:hypothetical protein